jgi:hypothetical protein
MFRQTIAPKMRTVIEHEGHCVSVASEVWGGKLDRFGERIYSQVDRVDLAGRCGFVCTGIKQPKWSAQRFQSDMREIAR